MPETVIDTFRRPHEISDSAAADAKPLINMLDYFPAAEFEVFTSCELDFDQIVCPLLYEHDFLFVRIRPEWHIRYNWSCRVLVIDILNREIFRMPLLSGRRERFQPQTVVNSIDRYSRALETALSQTMKKLILARPKI